MTYRKEVNSPDGNYRGWSTVGGFSLWMENGDLRAKSVHRFEARNLGDDAFGCQVRYEHRLEHFRNDEWQPVPGGEDSVGPDGSGFRLGKNSVYNDEDLEHEKGNQFSARRDTRVANPPSGRKYRIAAYTNLEADDYMDCKVSHTTDEYIVP